MPYDRFLRTAERVAHDLPILCRRYGVNFTQVAQRLVSLQDKSGNRRGGLEFFMMEVDEGWQCAAAIGEPGFSRFPIWWSMSEIGAARQFCVCGKHDVRAGGQSRRVTSI